VKPPSFEYFDPRSAEEAVGLLAEHGDEARVLAGGQSLVPLMNLRLAQPGVLVDLNRVAGLGGIEAWDGGLAIGAMVRQSELESSALAAERCPLLVEAVELVGHPPIRHRGTVGGSVAHGDPAAELPAAFLALEAEIVARGPGGVRTIAATDFFKGELTTDLAPDELLGGIRVPGLPPRTGTAFVELARRHGDYAIVGVAAIVSLDESGRCARARIALCGAGPTPIRARDAEASLRGEALVDSIVEAAAARAAAETDPHGDVHGSADYRRKMAMVFTKRALTLARERAARADDGR
jgi:carbon-monoxide dehydrogenase medium subunit